MFNVGGMELLVIALVALVVLGPDKLPKAIRQIGQVTGELRRISQGFQTDLKGALDDAEKQAEAEKRTERASAEAAAVAVPGPTTPSPGTSEAPPVAGSDPDAGVAAAQAELAALESERKSDASRAPAADGDAPTA